MALTWTTTADVTTRWVGPEAIPADDAMIATLLEDAEDTILGEDPAIQTRIDLLELPIQRVRKVAARLVIRHLRNPAGQRSVMDTGGPYARNVVFGGDEPGSLYLTEQDRDELGLRASSGAFTVDTMPPGSTLEVITADSYPWEPLL